MFKITLADYAGFCFGVKRAVELAEEALGKGTVASLGSLIHNQDEVERLKKLGLREIKELGADEKVQDKPHAVLIRTHGVGPETYTFLQQKGYEIIDATCPHVRKAQTVAQEAQAEGYQVIIFGDRNHPEVQGIQGWAGGQALIVSSVEELKECRERNIPHNKVAVLAQTTEKEERFAEIVRYLQENVSELQVLATICSATRLRQEAVAKLAQEVDLMIVIGGKNSSNSKKLAEACINQGIPTYFIERAAELVGSWFQGKTHIGVTAGASTPDWIIKEVIAQMEEMNKINEDQYEIKNYQPGDMVEGTVVQINNDEVLVDIGGKSEGIVPVAELGVKVNPKEYLQLGQTILVEVLKEDREGNIILSHKNAFFEEAFNKISKAKESGATLEATVTDVVKGGLLVDIFGVRGFVPASQVERSFVEDLRIYLQKKLRLKVIEFDREKKKVVLSQRVILEEEYEQKRKALWEEIKEGETRKGIVKKIMNFGAFVDIGGADGLLHISELGWNKVNHPSEVLREGDEVEVYVLKIDREIQKVSLSLKKLLADPWQELIQKYQEGSIVRGKVVRILPFGAFIQIEPGLEGLVHISQISEKRINKVEDVLKVGQEIEAKIVQIDPEEKKIKLSMKDIVKDEEKQEYTTFMNQQPEEENATIGDLLKAKTELTKENPQKESLPEDSSLKEDSKKESTPDVADPELGKKETTKEKAQGKAKKVD